MDRTKVSVGKFDDPDDSLEYWLTRPVEERLRAAPCPEDLLWVMQLEPDFNGFLKSLNLNKAEYLLIGGLAVALSGYIRATNNLTCG